MKNMRSRIVSRGCLFSALFVLAQQAQAQPENTACPEADIAVVGVNVVSMLRDGVDPSRTVLIDGDRIVAVVNAAELQLQGCSAITLIDGTGKYLMPGLTDMHVHLPGNDNVPWFEDRGVAAIEDTLLLLVANGVTTIRNMLGDDYVLELRGRIARREVLGPRIYTASPSLDGEHTKTVDDAIAQVKDYKTKKYDFLKLRPGLSPEVFSAIADTAREQDIQFVGHISPAIGIERSLTGGYYAIEHLDGYIEGLVPKEIELDPADTFYMGLGFVDKVDRQNIAALIEKTRVSGVWMVPTQGLFELWSLNDMDTLVTEPGLAYLPQQIRERWARWGEWLDGYRARSGDFIALRKDLVSAMNTAGIKLLFGSDSPHLFSVPGFSVHHEIAALKRAGLSDYQVLQAATANPGAYFGKEGIMGVVQQGGDADLLLLDANPLADAANVDAISGVILAGNWYPKAFIDERLEQIRKKYQ